MSRKKNVGKRLKAERLKQGISIRGLADEIGVSAMTISRVERGITEPDYFSQGNIERWIATGKDQDAPARRSYNHRIGDAERRISKLEDKVFKGKKKS